MAVPSWQLPVKLLHAINSSDSGLLPSHPAVDWDVMITVGSCTYPALNLAIERASIDVVRFLLSQHCSVMRTDSIGNTALHCAALHGRADIAGLLLENRAKVNAANAERCTPLHLAALHGNTDLTAVLLAAGADPGLRDMNSATPLHLCCARGHSEAALLILGAGAAPDVRLTPSTDTALHVVARSGSGDDASERHLVAGLVTRCPRLLNAVNSQLCTPLAVAVAARNVTVIEALLENGASWQPLDRLGSQHLLQPAATGGRLRLLRELLKEGEATGTVGGDALVAAYRAEQWEAVELLLCAGVGTGTVRKENLLNTAPDRLQRMTAQPTQLAQTCRFVFLTSQHEHNNLVDHQRKKLPQLIRRYLDFDIL